MMSFLQQEKMYCPSFSTVSEMRHFTSIAKKYTEILYSEKGSLEKLLPVDFLIFLDIPVEDKRLKLVDNSIYLPLNEDIFIDPSIMLNIVKTLHIYPDDYRKNTFTKIAFFIVKMNLKKYPSDFLYNEIANHLKIK